eukprot:scaffold290968_cov29-Tisochrysis_lutea.AAC.1
MERGRGGGKGGEKRVREREREGEGEPEVDVDTGIRGCTRCAARGLGSARVICQVQVRAQRAKYTCLFYMILFATSQIKNKVDGRRGRHGRAHAERCGISAADSHFTSLVRGFRSIFRKQDMRYPPRSTYTTMLLPTHHTLHTEQVDSTLRLHTERVDSTR